MEDSPAGSYTPTSKKDPPLLEKQLALEHIATVSSSVPDVHTSMWMGLYNHVAVRAVPSTDQIWTQRKESGMLTGCLTPPAPHTVNYGHCY